MEPHLCVGVDVGCKAHRVGIACPDGSLLEEFAISHNEAGFQEFFRRVEERSLESLSLWRWRDTTATLVRSTGSFRRRDTGCTTSTT